MQYLCGLLSSAYPQNTHSTVYYTHRTGGGYAERIVQNPGSNVVVQVPRKRGRERSEKAQGSLRETARRRTRLRTETRIHNVCWRVDSPRIRSQVRLAACQ